MTARTLYEANGHRFILLEGFGHGEMVPTNQVLIHDGDEGILLDPGGHKVHYDLMDTIAGLMPINQLKYLFFSHQDPDIVAAVNAWLMLSDADAYISELWLRFVPHFGVDELMVSRLKGIPDAGMRLPLGNGELVFVPAHFLHSCGNFQVYDPQSKILFSGDMGANLVASDDLYRPYKKLKDAIPHMEAFHRRYMNSRKVCRYWANMVRELDVEWLVPQHGRPFKGRKVVREFLDWISDLDCGIDLMTQADYQIP